MISGSQVLASIDQTLNKARSNVDHVGNEIESISRRLQDQQKLRTEEFRQLARLRLGTLADNSLVQHIDEVEKQAIALLDQPLDEFRAPLYDIHGLLDQLWVIIDPENWTTC